jgi:hypothetical protein
LKADLKIFHHQSQDAWDEDLPWVSVAFNTAIHESTGFSPDKIFLGRKLRCPLLTRWDLSCMSNSDTAATDQSFWTQAYTNLKQARDKVDRRYNAGRDPHSYQVGDTVVYRMNLASSKAQGISAQLLLRWSEPVVVAMIVRPNVVLLANPDTGVIIIGTHVLQLKPYVR